MSTSDRFINFGIDHGTCNSAIAVMTTTGPEIIRPGGFDLTMPSVVYILANGRVIVGNEARNAMISGSPDKGDGHTSYKPQIGQDYRYHFPASQQVKTAPELGAIVIGELLKAYRDETQRSPRAAVITVPAKFKQPEREGTRQAALLAGLEHVEMLQEPVAAALACGFTADRNARSQWIVFDLGAGTLDVSLVLVRDGDLIVPEKGNEGDNYLGGTRFDRDLLDFVLGPVRSDPNYHGIMERNSQLQPGYTPLRKLYQLDSFNVESHQQAWGRLLLAVEKAKIELSTREEAEVSLNSDLMKDEAGQRVEVAVRVTRSAYERIIGPHVEKAVSVCQNLLRRNNLQPGDISSLILIGGPTKTPYIRSVLHKRLNIDLQSNIDPMTAVAAGSAIYAATKEIPRHLWPQRVPAGQTGAARLTLEYEPGAKSPVHFVAGTVQGPALEKGGLTVVFSRTDTLWRSQPIEVSADGVFEAELMLFESPQRTLSSFETVLRNAEGTILDHIKEPNVWYPMGEPVMALPNSYRVALDNNKSSLLVPTGTALPTEIDRGPFLTTKPLAKGSNGDVLRIPILEGVTNHLGDENEAADCNLHIGTLIIEGNDSKVTRDVPIGAKVELNVKVDASQKITVVADVPVLEEDFPATFHHEPTLVPLEAIRARFEMLQNDLQQMRDLDQRRPQPGVTDILSTLDSIECVPQIEKQLTRAEGSEKGARQDAHEQVLKLAGTLHVIQKKQTRVRLEDLIAELGPLCNNEEKAELLDLSSAFASTPPEDHKALEHIETSFKALDRQVRTGPCVELLIDVMACSDRKVTAHQNEVFKRAGKLVDRYVESDHGRKLSPAEIGEMKQMHEEMSKAYPDLPTWRKEKLDEYGGDPVIAAMSMTNADIRSGS